MKQPNILLCLTDQQRYDSLGCYGVPGVHTPNLDRMVIRLLNWLAFQDFQGRGRGPDVTPTDPQERHLGRVV